MRKLASIVTIDKVSPIPDADRLETATMIGKTWEVVVGKGDFKSGDKAVYFEIDSYLPADDKRYEFLHSRCLRKFTSKKGEVLAEGVRINTVKLRGVISQGMLMPIVLFPEVSDGTDDTDLTEILKVKHYDEIEEALRPFSGAKVSAEAYGSFPTAYIPKTDEERIQNLGIYFEKMKGRFFQVTEKADGMSVTMFYSPTIDAKHPFGVCSRNLRLKPVMSDGTVPLPWQMANTYFVESNLKRYCELSGDELAIQGELVGPGINGNRDKRTEHEWLVFRIFDIRKQMFVNPDYVRYLCQFQFKLPHVKIIDRGIKVFDEYPTFEKLMDYAQGKTDRGNEREGIVCKTVEAPYVSFKVVSNKYLLKGE